MGLARPYFDRNHFKNMSQDELIDALIEAKTRCFELNAQVHRYHERAVASGDPWYGTGHPVPYTPADGQW